MKPIVIRDFSLHLNKSTIADIEEWHQTVCIHATEDITINVQARQTVATNIYCQVEVWVTFIYFS
jgi:hypothetical protein